MSGYDPAFFADRAIPLPELTATQKRLRAPLKGTTRSFVLRYTHFSIVLNKSRKFAFFTACNIDGKQWKALKQINEVFTYEQRVQLAHQTGNELYDLHSGIGINDFDKGHLVKFQDPQWGTAATITQAALDTMTFANCVPQHHSLNRGAWKGLEDYIIRKFTRKTGVDGQKVTVFCGPMLLKNDPFYIDAVQGLPFQLPVHFWKVVVYKNRSDSLSAVAFLMSQKAVLLKHGFVVEEKTNVQLARRATADFFSDFTKGEPYQVSIDFLEKTTGYRFGLQHLLQPYTQSVATEIIFKRVEIPVKTRGVDQLPFKDRPLPYLYEGIRL